MSNSSDRRKFIKHLGLGGLAATVAPTSLLAGEQQSKKEESSKGFKYLPSKHAYNDTYTGEYQGHHQPHHGHGGGRVAITSTRSRTGHR
jgi:hypothetical protein